VSARTITAIARVALLVAVAAILWLATTDRAMPDVATVSDKANHLAAFLALGLLADRSFPETRFGLVKALALFAFGASIEGLQVLLPHREASAWDLAANAAGIALYASTRPLFLMIPVLRPAPKD
jgi:VanZ family protein